MRQFKLSKSGKCIEAEDGEQKDSLPDICNGAVGSRVCLRKSWASAANARGKSAVSPSAVELPNLKSMIFLV